jgi:hypothetical protein
MPMWFTATYAGTADFALDQTIGRRLRTTAMQYANYQVAAYWHRKILPRHFEKYNRRRYKHKKRKAPYSRIKRWMAQGQQFYDPKTGQLEKVRVRKSGFVDVVRSGATERKAERSRTIRPTATGFTLRMRVPTYITQRRKRANYPNMKREISEITSREATDMAREWWKHYRIFLEAHKVKVKRRTRR